MDEVFDLSLFGNEPLPLVVRPKKPLDRRGFVEVLRDRRSQLRSLMLQHGGLLFRGFPLGDADDFAAAMEALETGKSVDYIGGDSPRHKVKGAIYTSTEAPAAIKIPLHNELSFVRHFPKHIFFFCETAPEARGETILGDARRVYRSLDPLVRKRFIERQLKYVSCYYDKSLLMELVNSIQPSHKSWRDVFETSDRSAVEELCRANDFGFRWYNDNWITISQTRPAAMTHPETQEWVWFSQAHLYDFNPRLLGLWRWLGAKLLYARRHMRLHEIFFADGSRIPRADLYHVLDTLDDCTVSFPWNRGDLLVLDNVLAMHGRATFTGRRRILAAMTS